MTTEQNTETVPKKRRITLKDGRYMIFYIFEDPPAPCPEGARARRPEPEPKPHAEDERGV